MIGNRGSWALGADHRRWILLNAVAATAGVNLVVNSVLAWTSTVGQRAVPTVSAPVVGTSTLVDTLGTLFILPMVTTFAVTWAVRRERRLDRLCRLRIGPRCHRLLHRAPVLLPFRAVAFGAVCLSVAGPVATVIVVGSRFGGVSPMVFVLYKAVLGVVLGLAVTPLIALVAMAEP